MAKRKWNFFSFVSIVLVASISSIGYAADTNETSCSGNPLEADEAVLLQTWADPVTRSSADQQTTADVSAVPTPSDLEVSQQTKQPTADVNAAATPLASEARGMEEWMAAQQTKQATDDGSAAPTSSMDLEADAQGPSFAELKAELEPASAALKAELGRLGMSQLMLRAIYLGLDHKVVAAMVADGAKDALIKLIMQTQGDGSLASERTHKQQGAANASSEEAFQSMRMLKRANLQLYMQMVDLKAELQESKRLLKESKRLLHQEHEEVLKSRAREKEAVEWAKRVSAQAAKETKLAKDTEHQAAKAASNLRSAMFKVKKDILVTADGTKESFGFTDPFVPGAARHTSFLSES